MNHFFLHGLGQSAACWEATLAALALPNPYCPDLPALLREGEGTYKALYHMFSSQCGTQACHLCGLSLGAVLALHYALDHPDQVRSLVLIAPQYRAPKRLLAIQAGLFRLMPDRAFVDTGLGKEEMRRLTASMAHLDFRGRLPHLPCPTLILCGTRDRVNQRAAKSLAALLPQAEFRPVPGAGHEVNRDAPEALAECLRQFYTS